MGTKVYKVKVTGQRILPGDITRWGRVIKVNTTPNNSIALHIESDGELDPKSTVTNEGYLLKTVAPTTACEVLRPLLVPDDE